MNGRGKFGPESLSIDAAAETARISETIRGYLGRVRRKGCVIAMSGGIDSSVVASLCVHALGGDRVLGLHLPERESSDDTLRLSRLMSGSLSIPAVLEDISPILEAAGCYRRRDDAIRTVFPGYGDGYRSKIVLPSVVDTDSFRLFSIVILAPDGTETRTRLTPEAYLHAPPQLVEDIRTS
jgi:NAD+ synthase